MLTVPVGRSAAAATIALAMDPARAEASPNRRSADGSCPLVVDGSTVSPSPQPVRPLHLRPGLVAWVALGGVVGAAARLGVIQVTPSPGGWPMATFLVNTTGAFALGLVLEALARAGPDTGGRRLARLWLGTGFCGAFTTYSSFAVDADQLLRTGRVGLALAYLAATLVVGALATGAGIAAAALVRRRTP